ncbi:hypothetical protein DB346_07350 [Verrucomicrobia bacterium LW23]|nr:hypothetical protein DB346_07350 [Verrucomicrobia bacterium LW23]
MSDFRRNAERQAGEQQNVNGLLKIVGFALLSGIMLVAGLAGYGGYVLFEQIKENSATIAAAEANLRAETDALRGELKRLERAQGEADRIAREQQEVLSHLTRKTDEILETIRKESAQRGKELADVRDELKARSREIMDTRSETRKAQRDADELRERVDRLTTRPRTTSTSGTAPSVH